MFSESKKSTKTLTRLEVILCLGLLQLVHTKQNHAKSQKLQYYTNTNVNLTKLKQVAVTHMIILTKKLNHNLEKES